VTRKISTSAPLFYVQHLTYNFPLLPSFPPSLPPSLPPSRFIVCDQHKSQARFLMAKLNPSITHHTVRTGREGGREGGVKGGDFALLWVVLSSFDILF